MIEYVGYCFVYLFLGTICLLFWYDMICYIGRKVVYTQGLRELLNR